ncbi:hypothetical protein BB559_005581 [Furculomyces boomerangus]|uniref:SGNH hydrolase-type esterase domain-containing protein n=2 Tax=Harpellales TaxID=61421 RepID=A0A2T9Y7T5_9FUNG|nr:hypothetical protein BB559_005581 [Furculomyces boomerangus]PVZ98158.1 hypothetical protein BB558_005849 [Smittium angustum]
MLKCIGFRQAIELIASDFGLFIHICVTSVLNFLFQLFCNNKLYQHKIVVIGDQFGVGCGDSLLSNGFTGLCNHLWKLINKSEVLRQNWVMFNCAEFESRSEDWLPGSEKMLFEGVFENRKFSNCEIVIIMLGVQDGSLFFMGERTQSPDKTAGNIVKIAEALEKMGKTVCVSYVPNPDSWEMKQHNNISQSYEHSTNQYIEKLLGKEKRKSLILGPHCDISNYEYFRSDFYDPERPMFNKKGYGFLCSEFFEILRPTLVRTEFESLLGSK